MLFSLAIHGDANIYYFQFLNGRVNFGNFDVYIVCFVVR